MHPGCLTETKCSLWWKHKSNGFHPERCSTYYRCFNCWQEKKFRIYRSPWKNCEYLPSILITQMIADVFLQALRFCIPIMTKHPSFSNLSTPACHLSYVDWQTPYTFRKILLHNFATFSKRLVDACGKHSDATGMFSLQENVKSPSVLQNMM
jgi:hypothetical protein